MDPSCGCEFGDALDGRVGEPGEDGAEVVAHRDEPAGAFNLSTTARMAAKSKQATGWVRPLEKWNRSRVPRFGAKAEQGDASLNPDEFVITPPLQLDRRVTERLFASTDSPIFGTCWDSRVLDHRQKTCRAGLPERAVALTMKA